MPNYTPAPAQTTGRICLEDVPAMTGIRSLASLSVAAAPILALLVSVLTFAHPLEG